MDLAATNIHIIVNPVAGTALPPYAVIGETLGSLQSRTTLHFSRQDYSAANCAQDALDAGADLIIAYGGDGTVVEVASALHPHDVPLGIMPGGTANIISHELDIPQDPQQALDLILDEDAREIRPIDAGRVGEDHFLLRTSIGWEAELSIRPSREDKSAWGRLAYTRAALEALNDMQPVTYHITLDDGTEHHVEGIGCSVCNIANVGIGGLRLSLDITPDDGLLHVLILQNDRIQAILDITQNLLASSLPLDIDEQLVHYSSRRITIEPDQPQRMSRDGEQVDPEFPLTVECVPNYISVITPKRP